MKEEYQSMLELIQMDVKNNIQIDHFTWSKEKGDFKKNTPMDFNKASDILVDLNEMNYEPKDWHSTGNRKFDKEFKERREPLYVPHNSSSFLATRKMNLRKFSNMFSLCTLFSSSNELIRLDIGKTKLKQYIEAGETLYIFDIDKFFESLKIKYFKPSFELSNFAKSILKDDNFKFHMDSLLDQSISANIMFQIREELLKELDVLEIELGTDEIIIVSNIEKSTRRLQILEAIIERVLSKFELKLNKSKTKIITDFNIDLFMKISSLSSGFQIFNYSDFDPIGKSKTYEEMFEDLRINPLWFNHLNKYLIEQKVKIEEDSVLKSAYNSVFGTMCYNDSQLFFEKIILKNKHI